MVNLKKIKDELNLLKNAEKNNKVLVNLLDQRTTLMKTIPKKLNLSQQITNDNLFQTDIQRVISYIDKHEYDYASQLINNMPTQRCSLEVLKNNEVYNKLLNSYKQNITSQYEIHNKIDRNTNNHH